MTRTIADAYPDAASALKRGGYPNIAAMLGVFHRQVDMDRALGTNSTVSNWCRGANIPSYHLEQKAEAFMREWRKENETPEVVQTTAAPPPAVTAPATPETTFLVIANGNAKKVQKVLALMGCEIVEI